MWPDGAISAAPTPQLSFLGEQEERHRFIVFEADTQFTSGGRWADDDATGGLTPSRTYADLAKSVVSRVKDRVQTIGRNLDSAVRSGIGVSPSMVFSSLAGPATAPVLQGASLAVPATPAPATSAWTRMCVQQADLCLLVGQAHTPPGLSATEQATVYKPHQGRASALDPSSGTAFNLGAASPISPLITPVVSARGVDSVDARRDAAVSLAEGGAAPLSRTMARKELILLHHDPHRRPQGTRNWLRPRRVAWWHHVRTWADEADFDRVARHICGQSRAVVLSGGGSRGLAHLGVLRTLEERGLPVDVIGGTSQGAFTGGCYAMTMSSPA